MNVGGLDRTADTQLFVGNRGLRILREDPAAFKLLDYELSENKRRFDGKSVWNGCQRISVAGTWERADISDIICDDVAMNLLTPQAFSDESLRFFLDEDLQKL